MAQLTLRNQLITAANQFHQLGWMFGTAGNLSAREEDNTFWITASGKSKGKLTESDFVRLNLAGEIIESPHPNNRPSAETSIHRVIYQLFPDAKACYHVHSVEANLVSQFMAESGTKFDLPNLEMLKGLGIWEENPNVSMPVFINHLEVEKIAKEIELRFSETKPLIPALLIINHGVTVWGNSCDRAQNHLEIAEYLFRYLVASANF